MSVSLVYAVAAAALMVAAFAGWLTLRSRPVNNPLFYAVSVVEIALIVQMVVGCTALAHTDRVVDGVTLVSYLLTVVAIPPAAVLWGIAEKSRWGVGVVAVGMLTVAAMGLRIVQVWSGRYV